MRLVHTIIEGDVGKNAISIGHPNGKVKVLWLSNVIGYVQKIDVGKQIYESGSGMLQVENQEQMETRVKNS